MSEELSPAVTSAGEIPRSDANGVPEETRHAVGVFFASEAQQEQLSRFVHHLATSAVERGLIGPREVPRLWGRHVLNCAAVAPLLPVDSTLMDVGSGAGLPGVVLAIARPDVAVTLVEPLQRRAVWLSEVTTDLGLANVVVHRGRAEELRTGELFHVVTARAVAALEVLAGWCLPHVRPEGELIALKGQSAAEEVAAAESRLRALGAVSWVVEQCGDGVLEEPTTVVRVRMGAGVRRGPGASRRSAQQQARGTSQRSGGQSAAQRPARRLPGAGKSGGAAREGRRRPGPGDGRPSES